MAEFIYFRTELLYRFFGPKGTLKGLKNKKTFEPAFYGLLASNFR